MAIKIFITQDMLVKKHLPAGSLHSSFIGKGDHVNNGLFHCSSTKLMSRVFISKCSKTMMFLGVSFDSGVGVLTPEHNVRSQFYTQEFGRVGRNIIT